MLTRSAMSPTESEALLQESENHSVNLSIGAGLDCLPWRLTNPLIA